MIQYPSVLPGPLLSGHALNKTPNILRTEMDSGQARVRRRFKSVPTIMPSTWLFTQEEAARFEWFIENTLMGAVAWFEMPVKTPIGMRKGILRFVNNPIENCKPTSPKKWQYQANVELKIRPVLEVYAPANPLGHGTLGQDLTG